MKRFTLITLCLLITCTLIFASCQSTPQTDKLCRWEDEELHYNITLVDTKAQSTIGSDVYLKDATTVISADEIVPQDVFGTLDIKISKNDAGNYVYKTHQTVYLGFNTTDYEKIKNLEGLSDLEGVPLSVVSPDLHYVRCQTDTMVEFTQKQLPVKSSKEIHGVYASNNGHSTITNLKVETVYNLDKSVAKVSVDGGEPTENKISYKNGSNFIDANQLAIYSRSLNKNESSFQDVPSATVYEPLSNTAKTVYYANYRYEDKVHLQNNDCNAKLSSVCVYLDNTTEASKLMYISNVPSTLNSQTLDCVFDGSSSIPKLSITTMSVGYLSFELDFTSLAGGSAVLEAVTVH